MKLSKYNMFDRKKIRFIIVGIIGAIIELALFSKFTRVELSVASSNFLAFHCAFLICFFLHYYYTHQKMYDGFGIMAGGLMKYATLMYIQLLFSTILLWILIDRYGWNAELGKITQIGVVTPVSYIVQKYFIFPRS